MRISADEARSAGVHSQSEIIPLTPTEHHSRTTCDLCLLTLQLQKRGQKTNETDVVSRQFKYGFFLRRLDSGSPRVNCKPVCVSWCVVDKDLPSSALMISLAGSCTCGVSEYSTVMTVSQMWGVGMTSSSCMTFLFKKNWLTCQLMHNLSEQNQTLTFPLAWCSGALKCQP